MAGGVAEPAGDPGVTTTLGGSVDDPSDEGLSPSQATSAMASTQIDTVVTNVRTSAPGGRELDEHIDRPQPW